MEKCVPHFHLCVNESLVFIFEEFEETLGIAAILFSSGLPYVYPVRIFFVADAAETRFYCHA